MLNYLRTALVLNKNDLKIIHYSFYLRLIVFLAI